MLVTVLRNRRSDLQMSFFILVTLFTVSSTMMYYTETQAQPEEFSTIWHAMVRAAQGHTSYLRIVLVCAFHASCFTLSFVAGTL